MSVQLNAQNEYTQRFLDLRAKMNDPTNGYFSPDGVPYHSVETLMAEAPDYGHETTSEAYSYWIWMEAMYGGISGDWAPLNNAWSIMEATAIPNSQQQPTSSSYDPASPATYAGEYPLPDYYPSPFENNVPVGVDPVSADLTATYGSDIYAMHWLFDCDNFYGYGNLGDGVSTPSYINTFQRGEQESVWETVPHPSWEDFSWGSNEGTGFLKLFIDDPNPAKQWRYTNAPDADARAVQAMYWATQFTKEQGLDPASTIPIAKASKMGDFVRLSMFDKYFKPIGVQDKMGAGATDYQSSHYLLSWYFAWGGPLTSQGWAWRVSSSHSHFGYQNPVAAYALSEVDELMPISSTGSRDWGKSMERQLEFYTWLQSAEGAIAGGATNSLNGNYSAYPAGTATFYDMAYQEHPVYHDPGSNQWIGMQAWSMERVAELYYISNNVMAKNLLEKWIEWIKSEVHFFDDGTFEIPATLEWTGQPNTWNPSNPSANTNLHVSVKEYGVDLGISACLAKAFTYYAAATEKYGTLDAEVQGIAKELLDRIWSNYYEEDGIGVAVEEKCTSFKRFFEQEVYVPDGFSGTMANGDVIEPGVTFIELRSKYRDDPNFAALEAAYNAGEDYKTKFHRFWAQADIALANAEYGRLFGEKPVIRVTDVSVSPATASIALDGTVNLTSTISPFNATNQAVSWTSSDSSIASVNSDGVVTGNALGSATVTATTEDGGFTDNCVVTVTSTPVYTLSITTSGLGTVELLPAGGSYSEGTEVTLTAIADEGYVFSGWSGDLSGSINPNSITMDDNKAVMAIFSEIPVGCENPESISLPFVQNGSGEFCWITSGDIEYINSWNLDKLEINGIDFTNAWSNTMPPKVDGLYNIHYVSSVGWAHLEIAGTNGTTPTSYSLTSSVIGQGAISPASGTYDEGTVVNISATPATGWKFVEWSQDASGTSATTSVTMDADKSVTATFTEILNPVDYTLLVSTSGEGSVTLDPTGGLYAEGSTVNLLAIPASGYKFDNWTGDISSTSAAVSITMNSDKNVTANFSEEIIGECDFGTPTATPLPSVNTSYSNVHVIGDGPDLSNVTKFTINWDLANNGLWQISMSTNNGQPSWWNDLYSKQTNNFSSAQPGITFSGTGFPGLDGDYYVTLDNGNLVMEAQSGDYIIYFSNSATSPCQNFKDVDSKTSINSLANVKVYPNPFSNELTINTEGVDFINRIQILNTNGQVVHQQTDIKVESETHISFEGASGIYILKIETNNDTFVKQISKN